MSVSLTVKADNGSYRYGERRLQIDNIISERETVHNNESVTTNGPLMLDAPLEIRGKVTIE